MELTDLSRGMVNGDFARNNLFEVEIPFLGEDFRFKCKAAPMPAAQVENIPVSYQNRKYNIGGDRTFEAWTISIYNDEDHGTRQKILDWQAMVHGQGNVISGSKPADYKKTAQIRQISRNGESVTKEYQLFGGYPTVVGEIQMDWDTNNEVEVFEVTIVYDYWL